MRAVAAALCALFLLAGGCAEPASTTTPATSTAASSPVAPSTSTPSETGTEASSADPGGAEAPVPESLRFRAETVTGEPFEGAALAGRPVLLWFWAPWCPTCRSQIPQVQEIATRFGDDVHVVGVGSLDDAEAIEGFAREVPGPTHLTDVDGTVWRHFGVVEQSSFVLLDADGGEVFTAGYGGADDLAERVAEQVG
jgi:thiol-disulfide isomerase/thioredoxin